MQSVKKLQPRRAINQRTARDDLATDASAGKKVRKKPRNDRAAKPNADTVHNRPRRSAKIKVGHTNHNKSAVQPARVRLQKPAAKSLPRPILITADLHLSERLVDKYRRDGLETVRRIGREHDVECFFILGDLTERKDQHSAWLVNTVVDEILAFREIAPVIILRGNHDYINEEHAFFTFLNEFEDVAFMNYPQKMNWPFMDITIEFIPHGHDMVAQLDKAKADLVLTHGTFDGALSNGQKLMGITRKVIRQRTISGDVHVPQSFGELTYVGAPYPIDFGDTYEPRVLLLDPAAGKGIQSIPVPGPRKRTITLSGDKWEFEQLDVRSGDMLKLRVELNTEDYARWSELKMELIEWAADSNIDLQLIEPVVTTALSRLKEKDDAPKTDAEHVENFSRKHKLDKGTRKVGLGLLK
jgi:predicted phosphodiesterase